MRDRLMGNRVPVLATSLALLLAFAPASASAAHQRQKIKNSVSASQLSHRTSVPIADLIGLAALPHVSTSEFDAKVIPTSPPGSTLHEGDMVQTTGWIHLVAFESGSKGDHDYHLQMTGDSSDGDNCLIVEVPAPDAADVPPNLSSKFDTERADLRAKLEHGAEFSSGGNVMTHPVHVTVTGQLFYDTSHQSNPSARGKRGMHAATAWELHPVTAIRYLGHASP